MGNLYPISYNSTGGFSQILGSEWFSIFTTPILSVLYRVFCRGLKGYPIRYCIGFLYDIY